MPKLNVPAALFIGLVVSFVGSFAVSAASALAHLSGDDGALLRCFVFDQGTSIAGALLLAVALFGVADRMTGRSRLLVQIAAWSHAAVAAWYVAQPLIASVSSSDAVAEKVEYAYRAIEAAAFGGLFALSIAARMWARPSGWLVVLGLIAKVFGTWTPYLGPWLAEHTWDGGIAVQLIWICRNAALCVGIAAMVHGALAGTQASADPKLAVVGFRIAGRALLVRVLAAIAMALVGIGILTHSGGVMTLFIGSALVTVATLVFCVGLLLVDRADLPGMPRIRVVLGVAMVACAVGFDLSKLEELARHASSERFWTVVAPLVSLTGTVLIVSAIQSFAAFRQNEHLRRTVGSRATLFFVLMAVSVLLPLVFGGLMGSMESVFVLVALAVTCGVIAMVSLAGMLSLLADAVSDVPQLPEARLRR